MPNTVGECEQAVWKSSLISGVCVNGNVSTLLHAPDSFEYVSYTILMQQICGMDVGKYFVTREQFTVWTPVVVIRVCPSSTYTITTITELS